MKIKLLEFFNKEYDGPKGSLVFMSCMGALSFAIVIFIVNQVAETSADPYADGEKVRLFSLYLVVCAMTIICKRYALIQMTTIAEQIVKKVRVRLTDKLRHTELQFLERMGEGGIYARIGQDTELISQGAIDVVIVFEAVFTSLFIYLYIAFLSLTSFTFIVSFILVLLGVFFFNYLKIKEKLKSAELKEADFLDALNDTLAGFKEIKINNKKNDDLFADIELLSKETEQFKTDAGLKNNRNIVLAFILYEGLMGIIIFAVPLFSHAHSEVVTKIVASMVFVFGFLTTLSRGIPIIVEINVAVENLERLEASFDNLGAITAVTAQDIPLGFQKIALNSVSFRYTDKEGEQLFTVGPVDLTIKQGEILFIVGGNGSGKSTLLKLLTGLYYPLTDGSITLDDQCITSENYQNYRELFSIIFTDFHLFKKLYGVESVAEQQVKALLRQMDVHKKTDYVDGKFTNIDLSTGQKKRLAYIAALLEDKPVYVFDEWAADQDPEFRRNFYEKFLEDLRAMNKTVIAVTHDDKYFDKADRVIKMEEGKVVVIES